MHVMLMLIGHRIIESKTDVNLVIICFKHSNRGDQNTILTVRQINCTTWCDSMMLMYCSILLILLQPPFAEKLRLFLKCSRNVNLSFVSLFEPLSD